MERDEDNEEETTAPEGAEETTELDETEEAPTEGRGSEVNADRIKVAKGREGGGGGGNGTTIRCIS